MVGLLLKKYSSALVLSMSSSIALIGCIILSFASSEMMTIVALALSGFGLAAGFPVVLGSIGDRFAQWSGTAFGITLTIALLGNMFINYLTGIAIENIGMNAYSWMLVISGMCTTVLVLITFRGKK